LLTTASPKRCLPTRLVCIRYGVCSRTVRRWEIQKILPAADFVINDRKYWWESTLDEHDRRAVAARGASVGPRHA
jgi:hypothetical protein